MDHTIDTAVHIAIGMWAAFLTCCALLPFRAFRQRLMPYSPAFIIGCGCWSLIPDLPVAIWALPGEARWAIELKRIFHTPILGNIFFMHAYIDQVLDRTRVHGGFELFGVVSVLVMFAAMAGIGAILYRRKRAYSQ
jgi:hypothetical protein